MGLLSLLGSIPVNANLRVQISNMEKENAAFKEKIAALEAENSALQKQLEECKQEREKLKERAKSKPGRVISDYDPFNPSGPDGWMAR